MSDWQERINSETAPLIRVEHDLRYRAASPLILAGRPWCDLGCGNGLAAASALGPERPRSVVLVDVEEDVVRRAGAELGIAETRGLSADLTDPEDLQRIREELRALGRRPVLTCFEVIEHLSDFIPLLRWAGEMVAQEEATFVISVPNDAFWSIQNPHHLSAWGEGAFEELRRLLPAGHTLLKQIALGGSMLADWDGAPRTEHLRLTAGGPQSIATHFLAAFGPDHEMVHRGALACEADLREQRRWERQRDSDAAVVQQIADENRQAVREQEQTIARQAEELRAMTAEFDAWRVYIHQLEGELGRPLAGTPEAGAPSPANQGDTGRTD